MITMLVALAARRKLTQRISSVWKPPVEERLTDLGILSSNARGFSCSCELHFIHVCAAAHALVLQHRQQLAGLTSSQRLRQLAEAVPPQHLHRVTIS